MKEKLVPKKKISRALFGSFVILGLSLLSTVIISQYVDKKNLREDTIRLDYEANLLVRRIQTRMETYESALIQTRAFLLNNGKFDRKKLKGYIHDTEILKRAPGLQGIGYAVVLSKDELAKQEKKLKLEIPDYKVWPLSTQDILVPIMLLELADDRNKITLGNEMFSEKISQEAMSLARDLNQAVMSQLVTLVQKDHGLKVAGFNIYLPYYKKWRDLRTLESRRSALLGYVYGPFRAEELFNAIFGAVPMILDVEIFEGKEARPEKLLYDSSPEGYPTFFTTRQIIINHRSLFLKFSPLPVFPWASSMLYTVLVFLTGLIASLLIFWFFVLSLKQMTVVRLIAQEKERLLQKEREHVAARDEFLSIASHELKTPLTSLKLQAQVVLRAIKRKDATVLSEEKVSNLAKQIDAQTTRLTRLVDDMLDLSRIRSGNLTISPEDCDLSEVVTGVVERLLPQFENYPSRAPQMLLTQGLVGHWDRFRIEQVMNNLVTNALRYGQGKEIKIRSFQQNKEACLEISDQGIGIAPENIAKIFDRFERAGISASEVSGLGLGLYITNQIVLAHHGRIEVESELKKGSTFRLVLPLKEGEDREDQKT
jgi:two-component system OmpR family sensor kinase